MKCFPQKLSFLTAVAALLFLSPLLSMELPAELPAELSDKTNSTPNQELIVFQQALPREIRKYIMHLLMQIVMSEYRLFFYKTLDISNSPIDLITFSNDGKMVILGSTSVPDAALYNCETEVQSPKRTFNHTILSAGFIPWGTSMLPIVLLGDNKTAYLYEVSQGGFLYSLDLEEALTAACFNKEGTLLVCATRRHLYMWNTQSRDRLLKIQTPCSMSSVSFSPDGSSILAAASPSGFSERLTREPVTIHTWDAVTGGHQRKTSLTKNGPVTLAVGPATDVFITQQSSGEPKSRGPIYLRTAHENKQLLSAKVNSRIFPGSFGPHGLTTTCSYFISTKVSFLLHPANVSHSYSVYVWSITKNKHRKLQTIADLSDRPCSATFSPDGKTLFIGTENGKVHLWKQADISKLVDKELLYAIIPSLAGVSANRTLVAALKNKASTLSPEFKELGVRSNEAWSLFKKAYLTLLPDDPKIETDGGDKSYLADQTHPEWPPYGDSKEESSSEGESDPEEENCSVM